MKVNEIWNHSGYIFINVYKKKKNIYKKIIKNQITSLARAEIIKPIYGESPDMEMSQLAFGSGNSTPSVSNTTLDNELYRVADTDLYTSDTGQATSAFYLSGVEYLAIVPSGVIEEIGFFAGSTAQAYGSGAGIDTGLLISRVLWSYEIESDYNVYIQRIDNITA